MSDISKHFVEFFSPGTFMPETSVREIEFWDVGLACEMAKSIKERHAAVPYAFRFITRSRGANDLDSRVTASSHLYYLGGVMRTREEVLAGDDPEERTLRFNVECNGIKRIIVNTNSWKFTGELRDDDVVLEWER